MEFRKYLQLEFDRRGYTTVDQMAAASGMSPDVGKPASEAEIKKPLFRGAKERKH